jgi:adenylate cyclase
MSAGETEPSGGLDRLDTPDEATEPKSRRRRLKRFAVKVDTQPSLLTAAGALRRRLPGDDRFGDSLSTAGSHPAEVVARGVSAFQPGRKSVAQELGLAGLQVWQSLSEATGRGRGDQELAVLFTDLVGFSAWALRAGDAATLELLRAVGTALEGAVTDHQGRIVKWLGDGIMATFLEARPAVDAALDAQVAVAEIELDGHTPRMRAGIHWGRPRKLGGDYLGVDVNVAARVGEAAKPDQVLVSEALLARIETKDLRTGRAKRLRADGAPSDLHVVPISRAS